jgi:hypothetical protein
LPATRAGSHPAGDQARACLRLAAVNSWLVVNPGRNQKSITPL